MIVIACIGNTEIALGSTRGIRIWARRGSASGDMIGLIEQALGEGERLLIRGEARPMLEHYFPGLPLISEGNLSLTQAREADRLTPVTRAALEASIGIAWPVCPEPSDLQRAAALELTLSDPNHRLHPVQQTHAVKEPKVKEPKVKKPKVKEPKVKEPKVKANSNQVWVDYSGKGNKGGIGLFGNVDGKSFSLSIQDGQASEALAVAYGAALIGQGTVYCDETHTVTKLSERLKSRGVTLKLVPRNNNKEAHQLARKGLESPVRSDLARKARSVLASALPQRLK